MTSPRPTNDERAWLASAYPQWEETFGPLWDDVERTWETMGEPGTLAYALPALCNLCQLPTVFVRPGHNTACTAEANGRRYLFCSEPCRWIFLQEPDRFGGHKSVIDRIVAGTAPGKLTDLHRWMGLEAPDRDGQGPSPRTQSVAAGLPSRRPEQTLMASVYLFGYLEDDYYGRVIVTPEQLTIGELAAQLAAWSYERGIPVGVTNEAGDDTGPASTDTCGWAPQR